MLEKIAIIGIGNMGLSFTRYALPLCKNVYIYDVDPEKTNQIINRLSNEINPFDPSPETIDIKKYENRLHICNDLKQLLELNPQLTVISTHKETHKELTILALQSGSHVLVEKPIALNLEEAKQMFEVAQQHNRFLFIDFTLHCYSEFEFLANKIHANKPVKYDVTRIAEINDPKSLNINAWFDLQIHDIDFCLQHFGWPTKVLCQARNDKESIMQWQYQDGLIVNMAAYMPAKHDTVFEYQFKCEFSDNTEIKFEYSDKNKSRKKTIRISKQNQVVDEITMNEKSVCRAVLEEVVHVITENKDALNHRLSGSNGIRALELIKATNYETISLVTS